MKNESDHFHTYLLRLWCVQYQGKWQWRASLESPHTGERSGFANLDDLCQYLKIRHALPEVKLEADTAPVHPPQPGREQEITRSQNKDATDQSFHAKQNGLETEKYP